ncbi:MAG: LysM peptidoglycan-binding domain-containing protein [Pseudonocardia sp.]|nr:LysM peptidoglycan-binding domain-containing protein [Pseudonocardia sp.]
MARYRGRHRATSTTGKTIARTALAGAVAGGPLLATTPAANAAPDSVWDRVAQCESSGNWNTDTGNGFFGGLQFTASTWRSFGGNVFAETANHASREQQIVVAERVLAGQGWGAWPVCSRKAGASGTAVTLRSTPAATPRPQAPPVVGGGYLIQRGDTLSSIAARRHVAGGYTALLAKNPALKNPNRIFPGQRITV